MLLTLTCTARPATNLGYLLHKHPDRVQAFEVSSGTAHVFYPQAEPDRCTAALLLEVDPVDLVRGRARGSAPEGFTLGQFVNDRPYAASSLLAVALGRVFRTAMSGRCDSHPELAATPIPLEIGVPALPCRGGAELATRLFEPLGWRVSARPVPLDEQFPAWGDSRYVDLTLTGQVRLADALNHLYVLLPVLDDAKHYWVSPDEVDKLIRAGTGWLAAHPDKSLITRRYLAYRGTLTRAALGRLAEVDDEDPDRLVASETEVGDEPDRPVPLAAQRRAAILAVLEAAGARRVGDLGCGEGALLAELLANPRFTQVIGADVSASALERAARRLKLPRMPAARRERLTLLQSSLTYRDERLSGLDAVVLSEVIEHVDPWRIPAVEQAVFGGAHPQLVLVTTPNREYNQRFEGLPPGSLRHRDHRFEWTRAEFAAWTRGVRDRYGYSVTLLPVGEPDPACGPPTQLAVFRRAGREPFPVDLLPPAGAPLPPPTGAQPPVPEPWPGPEPEGEPGPEASGGQFRSDRPSTADRAEVSE